MEVTAVSVKLPTFWQKSPAAWFIQAEAQFHLRNITCDPTKYYHVVAALDTETADRALSILACPPEENKYQALKAFLMSAFNLTEEERAQALFTMPGLGDRKPSELMDHMLALLGDHKPCFLFRHLFLAQLPDQIRAPLANSARKDDPRTLALEADQLYIASRNTQPALHQVKQRRQNPTHTTSADAGGFCFYHRQFGKHAKKCSPPCKFQNTQNQGNGQLGQH